MNSTPQLSNTGIAELLDDRILYLHSL